MTALLLAGAFAAGSATFLAVRDSVVPQTPDTQQEYRLETPSPAGSSVTVPDTQQGEQEEQQEQQEQQEQDLVAVDPSTQASQQPEADPREQTEEAVSASASNDTQVSRLYVKPVDGENLPAQRFFQLCGNLRFGIQPHGLDADGQVMIVK